MGHERIASSKETFQYIINVNMGPGHDCFVVGVFSISLVAHISPYLCLTLDNSQIQSPQTKFSVLVNFCLFLTIHGKLDSGPVSFSIKFPKSITSYRY